ncbi:MAG: ABC-type branched-chain amino acid transport system, periplasmic component [halophilic archaeon J07HX5]|nr:MAG: ABC-type branched-chain amino acid transport system, periplasmic component [halophilic archaeon J07HX5]
MSNQQYDAAADSETADRGLSRRQFIGTVGGSVIAGAAGCLGSSNSNAFKIGAALSLSTQGWETYGNTMLRAVRIAADQMQERGVFGDREVSVITEDTQVDPQTTRNKVEKLTTQDDVDVVVGPVSSANRIPAAELFRENQTPGLYAVEYEGAVAEDYCNPWLFKSAEVPEQQVEPFVPWLVDEYGSSFYLLGSDYTWPNEMNGQIQTVLENQGGEVVGEEYAALGETDFSSIIPRIENADPDVLFMTLTGASVPAIQEQMLNFDVRGQWTDVGISHGQGLLQGAPAEAVEDVVSCHSYMESLETDRNQQFVQAFRDRGTDVPITFLTGTTRVAMRLLEQAIETEGDASADGIQAGLRGVSAKTVVGEVAIETDQQATLPTYASRVNGERQHVPVESFDAVQPDPQCDSL